ncbi:cytochrome P450 714C2-like isoform X2 [Argentina anserina]|uniref:cytochrome P450 714C2-like isoform X2 n=1 Tax=Argentina anserina TaxID=57926 RepID=UPI0021762598|nr:cytochrome P450 714C2-like isoform X2 [Potentilla anserina]
MEAELAVTAEKIVLSVLVGGCLILFSYLYDLLLLRPKSIRSKLQKQGIRGPPPTFLLGTLPEMKRLQNKQQGQSTATTTTTDDDGRDRVASVSHQWHLKLFPHIEQWRSEYGPTFLYSTAHIQQLVTTDMELVKEFSLCKSLVLGNPSITSKVLGPLLGQGLLASNGSMWEHQRKIIAPELYPEKGMMNLIVDSTTSMLRTWDKEVHSQRGLAEIRVDNHLRNLSADVISKACFHSNYCQGEEIFSKIRKLQIVLAKGLLGIEGLTRWFPTPGNRKIWRLEKEIESLIMKVVKQRNEGSCEKDLLQMLLDGAKTSGNLHGLSQKKFIVDNCKTMFFAGHETTALVTSWSLLLLALHPDWQARARAEVLQLCGDKPPDADMLRRMKVLTMVIQEVLRLYPPVFFVAREVFEPITFKNITFPKGVLLQIPIPFLHQNPDLWGSDAHKFNPERFADGISKACKSPQAYMPFGAGSRICVGQHLAMTELKVFLSMMLSNFCFSFSSAYQHSPVYNIVTEPEHGFELEVSFTHRIGASSEQFICCYSVNKQLSLIHISNISFSI